LGRAARGPRGGAAGAAAERISGSAASPGSEDSPAPDLAVVAPGGGADSVGAAEGASAGAAVGAAPTSADTVLSVLGHLDPALAHRVYDGLGPVIDCQLAQDRAHVVLDGLLADRQGVGDLLVGHALGDVVEDLDLARRERREDRLRLLAVDGQLAELLEDARRDGRLREHLVVDQELALRDAAD